MLLSLCLRVFQPIMTVIMTCNRKHFSYHYLGFTHCLSNRYEPSGPLGLSNSSPKYLSTAQGRFCDI